MTLVRNPQIVQSQCPSCKQSLRIPSSWLGESMKCKHCGLIFQARPSDAKAPRLGTVKAGVPLPPVRPAAVPVARAAAPAPLPKALPATGYAAAIPVGPVAGALPAAIPMGQFKGALPAAIPAGPGMGGPAAIPVAALPANQAVPYARLGATPSKRRSRGVGQKVAFAAVFLLALGSLGGIVYLMGAASGPAPTEQHVDAGGDGAKIHPKGEAIPLPSSPTPSKKGPEIVSPPKSTEAPKATVSLPPPATMVKAPPKETPKSTGLPPKSTTTTPITTPTPLVKEPFPRRMMAVVPANYAFTNAVSYGSDARSLNAILRNFAELVRIPDDQLVVLSDRTDRANASRPPIKEMIELNVANFLKSCRPQDHIVLMFIGHGVEKDGKGYFMPLEGDKDDVATLIPLDWFYEQLKACPAQQKLFVVDICRYDPSRGDERGKVDPMGEKFDEALQNPPDGVQVLTACTAGQFSYEIDAKGNDDLGGVNGGVMINQIPDIKFKGGLRGVIQKPQDPIPAEALSRTLGSRTKSFTEFFLKKEQKVRLSGKVRESTLAYDPKTALAPHFELQLTEIFKSGVASADDIKRILKIANEIPPVKANDTGLALNFASLPPYPAKSIEPFKEDNAEDTPLRVLVKDAIKTLKETSGTFKEDFNAPQTNPQAENAFKDGIAKIDKDAAAIQFKLASAREDLMSDEIVAARDKETKYWQAAYDYTVARLSARIAYVYEYKVKLGEMRKEFPERDPTIHVGWRLASREKMDAVAKKDADEAQKILKKMGEDFKGTPWELIAKREKLAALGLEWKPKAR